MNCAKRPREPIRSPAVEKARKQERGTPMNRIIYIVGLVVIVLAILSFIGLA
jgi:hypothetical protein